jgi:putative oxidoreductase
MMQRLSLAFLSSYSDFGLLIMRIGLGLMMILHGWPKLAGGAETWEKLVAAMANVGVTAFPVFWGFMAAMTEVFGGLFLLLGFLTRLSSGLLAFVMLVAALMHLDAGDGLKGAGHAIELGTVFPRPDVCRRWKVRPRRISSIVLRAACRVYALPFSSV